MAEIDLELKQYIESLAQEYKPTELREIATDISKRYLENSGSNNHFIADDKYALTYAIMRLPATYSALKESLLHTLEVVHGYKINTVLDLGSGMGTAPLALQNILGDDARYTLIEREPSMIDLGEKLLSYKNINHKYIREDILSYVPDSRFDLVIFGYSLNEFSLEQQFEIIEKYLRVSNLILIVDPGTPLCHFNHMEIKERVLNMNYLVPAPCPFKGKCALNEDDWCHFVTRVSRSSLHKFLKNADVPYEDEKYTYLAITNQNCETDYSRILRHPKINGNSILLTLCNKCGICNKEIFKKDKDLYKKAKKSQSGDII